MAFADDLAFTFETQEKLEDVIVTLKKITITYNLKINKNKVINNSRVFKRIDSVKGVYRFQNIKYLGFTSSKKLQKLSNLQKLS